MLVLFLFLWVSFDIGAYVSAAGMLSEKLQCNLDDILARLALIERGRKHAKGDESTCEYVAYVFRGQGRRSREQWASDLEQLNDFC